MEHGQYRDALFDQYSRVGRAIAHPTRLKLLDLLAQANRTVEALATQVPASIATTSQHLQVLKHARLVETQRRGSYVEYRLADDDVADLARAVRHLAGRRLAEIDDITRRYLDGRRGLEPVDRETLVDRVRSGDVLVLDVRPSEEFAAGHVAGAVSVPLEELEERLAELPTDQELVAYCRGPHCVLAVKAVELLRARGYQAARLADSVDDLRESGVAVVQSTSREAS
jgi:rhodanese-related sulfurtransferase